MTASGACISATTREMGRPHTCREKYLGRVRKVDTACGGVVRDTGAPRSGARARPAMVRRGAKQWSTATNRADIVLATGEWPWRLSSSHSPASPGMCRCLRRGR